MENSAVFTAKLEFIISMVIFGTIGIFIRYIPLPSSLIACVRGIVGVLFLLCVLAFKKRRFSFKRIKKYAVILLLSGAFIGVNWILLFEAYRFTTVATATLCYYMAPVFVLMLSPLVLKEKLSVKNAVCVAVALIGMVLVSGVLQTGVGVSAEFKGILLGLGAAACYACVMLLNQKLKTLDAFDKTVAQLACAAIAVLPYVLITVDFPALKAEPWQMALLAAVCIIHTGIAYTMYFGSMKNIKAQTVAVLSYIDPIVAVILSALVLNESMDIFGIVGAVLILGAAIVNEMPVLDKKRVAE